MDDRLVRAQLDERTQGALARNAVQLIAKYAITPMPTFEKVEAWNQNRRHGRAYISNNRANFDMTVLIPDAGIDIKALEEAVRLFKDATGAFYNSVKPQ